MFAKKKFRLRCAAAGALGLACLLCGGCPPDAGTAFLLYERAGGIAGTDDQVRILADGTIQTSGKLIGDRAGTLTAAELAELTVLVQGWEALKTPAENDPCCDFFNIAITHAGKTLSWTNPATPLPEQLSRLATRIEEIAQTVPPVEGGP